MNILYENRVAIFYKLHLVAHEIESRFSKNATRSTMSQSTKKSNQGN